MALPMTQASRIRCRSTSHVVKSLDKLGLAYLHFIEPRSSGAGRAEVNHQNVPSAMVLFRPHWSGRLQHGFPITPYNRATFYGGEEAGYTDYPFYDELAPA
jgi:N-ethylmaleimide reductase